MVREKCVLDILCLNPVSGILMTEKLYQISSSLTNTPPHHPHRSLGGVKVWSDKVRYMQHTGTQPIFNTFWLKPDRAMALALSGIRLAKM